ncbi:MAG: rRNA maturation RNase YbeY [Phycisphaerae bacterium]|nr:rRNA maturation RNase YbeY [Phycisphaerae bacterium]
MKQTAKLLVTISRRTAVLRVPRKRIDALVRFIVRKERANVREVDVAVVDDWDMAKLNRTYHRVRGTTDVLSFDLSEPHEAIHAQIVVCAAEALRQAQRRGLAPRRELLLYVAHGLLHLIGYDDAAPKTSKQMARRQEELLSEFLRLTRKQTRDL